MERMLRAGYATFAWDKPGTGASTGEIDRNSLLEQRTQIVLDGLNAVRDHPLIVPDQIGLWGISQAGYVMPMVLKRNANIAFMIAVSCPGGPGFNQGVYLLSAQMACAGCPREKRLQVEARLRACSAAETYEEYVEAKELLISEPSFKRLAELGQRVDVTPRESWHREDFSKEYFSYDPMEIIEEVDIPILAVFGERDTQVDPFQGVEAYTRALESGGNPKSAVKLFAGTDHNILLSETGCIGERNSRSRSGWQNYPPEYLDAIEAWLTSLR
jgi:pimeloyl-ACP methyl ester carboxylesterase